MIANAAAEIAHTPAASPSTPSEKLTTFMISDEAEDGDDPAGVLAEAQRPDQRDA